MLLLKKIKGSFQFIDFLKLFLSESIFANTADNIAGAVFFFFRVLVQFYFLKLFFKNISYFFS